MSNKYNLLMDAARLMHSLADVLAAIADTYADVKLVADAEVIEAAEPPKALPKRRLSAWNRFVEFWHRKHSLVSQRM